MNNNQWRLIQSGMKNSAENMAIDEAILIAHSEGKTPPTIRFYGWNPATLSIGYFQKAEKEVDLNVLKQQGIGFVRRPTGGRAVFHDQELTYSVILSEDYPGMPTSVTDSYRVISTGLLKGFLNLGLQGEMVPLDTEEEQAKYQSLGSAACFDSPSNYELVVEGRKIAGSAQTRQRGVILQHGSILLDMDVDRLFELLRFPSVEAKEKIKGNFVTKAVAINQLRAQPVSFEEATNAFRKGFAAGLEVELVPGELTAYEKELAEELVHTRYASDAWNLKK
ncbi:lipoate--protein ligase family protein [Marininema halotolerans]|uniref:Lipoate-protein ligase A n=1 Tax=Marininema halotolerans TaxID=1155944 RepID=A0A1I6R4U8_9BACL|nr:biotin/lipoate A/B protein ligase family protein [Marininema halotolerans]SFS59518.1 lipoate-protein ligase A [Marininema halotolerans]